MEGKVSYIKGLIDGLDFDKNSKEFKVFNAINDFIDQYELVFRCMKKDFDNLKERVYDVEKILEEIYKEDNDECNECYCGCSGSSYHCPNCGDEIYPEFHGDNKIFCINCNAYVDADDSCRCEKDNS